MAAGRAVRRTADGREQLERRSVERERRGGVRRRQLGRDPVAQPRQPQRLGAASAEAVDALEHLDDDHTAAGGPELVDVRHPRGCVRHGPARERTAVLPHLAGEHERHAVLPVDVRRRYESGPEGDIADPQPADLRAACAQALLGHAHHVQEAANVQDDAPRSAYVRRPCGDCSESCW